MKASTLFLTLLCSIHSVFAKQLPAVIELDRYLVEAQALIDQEAFPQAIVWLNKAQKLNVPLPPQFHYLYGKSQFAHGRYQEAQNSFFDYLHYTGRLGEHYQDVLAMITASEKKLSEHSTSNGELPKSDNKNKVESDKAVEPTLASTSQSAEEQVKPLKLMERVKQFVRAKSGLSDGDQSMALQNKINTILQEHAIYERYGVDTPTLVYSVKAGYGDMLIVTRSEQGMEGVEVASHNVTIDSMPDSLNSSCSWDEQRCWISHPLNNQRWLEMNYNEEANKQLVSSLEALVSAMKN